MGFPCIGHEYVFEYWKSLREDGELVPLKSRFRPERFPHPELLPLICLIEFTAPGEARMRLNGTAMRDRYGYESKGINFLSLFSDEAKPQTEAFLRRICTFPYVQLARIELHRSRAPDIVTRSESLLCPLRFENGDNPLLLTCEIGLDDDFMADVRSKGANVDRIRVLSRSFVDIGAGTPDPDLTVLPAGSG